MALFGREARGIRLTREGAQFQRHARQILADVAAARLSLDVSSLVAGYVLSDTLSRFRRADPDAELSVVEDQPDHVEHLLLDGELDLAILVAESLRECAAAPVTGVGVTILPTLVRGHWSLEGDRIEIRDVSGDLPAIQVGLAWRKGAPLSAAARDFVGIWILHLRFLRPSAEAVPEGAAPQPERHAPGRQIPPRRVLRGKVNRLPGRQQRARHFHGQSWRVMRGTCLRRGPILRAASQTCFPVRSPCC